jgi:hypothetical protein
VQEKISFAHALLPFGTVGVAHAQIAHLVFANTQANPEKPKELFLFNARTELAAEEVFLKILIKGQNLIYGKENYKRESDGGNSMAIV